jgi:hypothetical protein
VLFAMLPVLSMYAANPGEGHPLEFRDSLRIVIAVSVVLWMVTSAVYRDLRKAALFVSVVLIVFVFFDSIYQPIETISLGGLRLLRRRYVVPLTYMAILACGVWLYRRATTPTRLTAFANLMALAVVLPPVVTMGLATARHVNESRPIASAPIAAGHVTARPDIYYLVFDRYADEQTVQAYGLDDDIDEFLVSKGFYVPPATRSNYIKTAFSLSSSLNAEYLDELARGRERSTSWTPVYDRLVHHRVGVFLRSIGYSYTHLGSWFYPTRENPHATRNVNYYTRVPRPVLLLLYSSLFAGIPQRLREPYFDDRLQNWYRVRLQIDDLLRLVPTPGPKFVFLHVLVPHPPYVFDRDGSFVRLEQEYERSFAENYRNQVVAANGMIRRLVDGILRESASPPVIIVQGDEGPYPPETLGDTFDWRTASASQLRVRSGILNAYHLPGRGADALYPTISPVNSFRVVFNAYFDTKLPLLPDRTIRHRSDLQPFAFDDISDVVTVAHSSRPRPD